MLRPDKWVDSKTLGVCNTAETGCFSYRAPCFCREKLIKALQIIVQQVVEGKPHINIHYGVQNQQPKRDVLMILRNKLLWLKLVINYPQDSVLNIGLAGKSI